MTDLLSPPPPARLTLPQQALANVLAAWQVEVIVSDDPKLSGRPDLEVMIAQILPAAREAVPAMFAPVLNAAAKVEACAAERLPRGHLHWFEADSLTRRALARFWLARGCAAWAAHEASLSPAPQKDAADAQP